MQRDVSIFAEPASVLRCARCLLALLQAPPSVGVHRRYVRKSGSVVIAHSSMKAASSYSIAKFDQ